MELFNLTVVILTILGATFMTLKVVEKYVEARVANFNDRLDAMWGSHNDLRLQFHVFTSKFGIDVEEIKDKAFWVDRESFVKVKQGWLRDELSGLED